VKRLFATAALALLLCGCTNGLIYTHTISPLDTNMDRTPAAAKTGAGNVKHLQYYVSVTWDSNGIGTIARENGIDTIYFADIETRSLFFGLWRQFTVHIYGR